MAVAAVELQIQRLVRLVALAVVRQELLAALLLEQEQQGKEIMVAVVAVAVAAVVLVAVVVLVQLVEMQLLQMVVLEVLVQHQA